MVLTTSQQTKPNPKYFRQFINSGQDAYPGKMARMVTEIYILVFFLFHIITVKKSVSKFLPKY